MRTQNRRRNRVDVKNELSGYFRLKIQEFATDATDGSGATVDSI
jgi:hypothetical protein